MRNIDYQFDTTSRNITKGKKAYVLGKCLEVVGILIPVGKLAEQILSKDMERILTAGDVINSVKEYKYPVIAAGVFIGAGIICKGVGKFQHWYYNKEL